jgi:hypothetical protein
MKIEISKSDFDRLNYLAANWYVVIGEKPKPIKDIIHDLIEEKMEKASPTEYKTTGFDRQ